MDSATRARFDEIQKGLLAQWDRIGSWNTREQVMVVVPFNMGGFGLAPTVLQAYEERSLFLLFLLRKPRARIIFVTSQPIAPEIVDYYLGLMPGVVPSQARRRVTFVSAGDARPISLTQKLLERPRLLARIRSLVGRPEIAHIVPFNTTELEVELVARLGIPMYAADPRFFPLGTKSGGRRIFAETGVPHPAGCEGLTSVADLVRAVTAVRRASPGVRSVMVKLNEGVSGLGNATVDLSGLPAPGAADEARAVEMAVRSLRLEAEGDADAYFAALGKEGGIVEERILGDEVMSPSVQLRNTPLGEVQLLSTHDQILGGPTGQSYLGCRFPAHPGYAALITREARKVGERLAEEGVIGRYALDFVVTRLAGGDWQPYAIEINLRKGGTTHPYLTLEFLTGGRYDPETARFRTPAGREKHYVASDHVESHAYRRLTPDDVFERTVLEGLHFDHVTQKGIVFHMLRCLTEAGRCGLTAVGDTPEEAQQIFERAVAALDAEAQDAAV